MYFKILYSSCRSYLACVRITNVISIKPTYASTFTLCKDFLIHFKYSIITLLNHLASDGVKIKSCWTASAQKKSLTKTAFNPFLHDFSRVSVWRVRSSAFRPRKIIQLLDKRKKGLTAQFSCDNAVRDEIFDSNFLPTKIFEFRVLLIGLILRRNFTGMLYFCCSFVCSRKISK